jgi:proteic killer suppression protein
MRSAVGWVTEAQPITSVPDNTPFPRLHIHLHTPAPAARINHRRNTPMKRRKRPITRIRNEAMPDRIEMDIIHVQPVIPIIVNRMFPKPSLPNPTLALANPARRARLPNRHAFRKRGRAFFVEDHRTRLVPPVLEARLFRKPQMIDDATNDIDLRAPPSNHFEKLRANLEGFHATRVNQKWRLLFRWNNATGEAHALYLDGHIHR